MKENWENLIGKRILLRRKYLSPISITEVTVVEISESGKYVKFRWQSGSEVWEEPEDEYSFSYDKILEVLAPKEEAASGDVSTAILTIATGKAIGAGINTLLKMLSEQEGKKPSAIVPTEEKEPDIISNPLTGKMESHDDNTSSPKPVDTSSIKYKIDNF